MRSATILQVTALALGACAARAPAGPPPRYVVVATTGELDGSQEDESGVYVDASGQPDLRLCQAQCGAVLRPGERAVACSSATTAPALRERLPSDPRLIVCKLEPGRR